jgi:hypothetical protein
MDKSKEDKLTAQELDKVAANLEFTLNSLDTDYQVGSLLKGIFHGISLKGQLLQAEYSKKRPSFVKLFFVAVLRILRYRSIAVSKKKVLFIRNSNKYHFKSLISPVHEMFYTESDLIVHSDKSFNSVRQEQMYYPSTISGFLKSIYLSWYLGKKASQKLEEIGFLIPEVEIRFQLWVSLMGYFGALNLCQRRKYKMILMDTDRGNSIAASFCLAASRLGVKSVTLQHGAIDLVRGYYPLLAEEIWCWGNFQKNILTQAGLEDRRIRIKGNPVARKTDFKNSMTNVMGFGLSGGHVIDREKDIIFWLLEQDELKGFDLIIKTKPSQKVLPWMEGVPRLKVYKTGEELSANDDFFQQIDLLIITMSSIGPEAIASGVPLWVYEMSIIDPRLDKLFVRTGLFPNISDPIELTKESASLKSNGLEYLKQLWLTQNNFIMNDYYCAVGNKAVKNICESIEQEIRDSN